MAVNPRFEIGCNNPDGVQFAGSYSTSQRGHFSTGPSIERSASFRENYEGRGLAQGGGNSGFSGNSGSGHGDLAPLAQVLSLDPVSLGEQKYARQLELRKATNAALGAAVDYSLPGNVQTRPVELLGPEELRRVKASIYDNLVRARERSRFMADAIVKLDKYRTSMNFRKRARPEPSIHEKPITTLSVERSRTIGSSVKICSSPSHTNASDTMLKTEDKNKGAVPNKRVRTSLADMKLEGRQNGLNMQRSSGFTDRGREFLRSNSSHGSQVEERDRLVSEGWEKTKMKGRRSGMKPDATGTTANGAVEGERDSKWQPRLNVEGRSRPSEGHGFRSGPVHGVSLVHKVETAVQQAMRLCNKNESGSSSPIGEKADHYIGLDKERVLSKNSIKSLQREENNLSNLATVTKAKATRAPRSGAVNPPLQAIRSSSLGDVWDRPPPNKAQVPVGPTNRKRPAPSRSSSPPVTQWGGQRQKMARVRRMNLVPPVGPLPNNDEALSSGEGIISREGNALVGRSNSNMSAGSSFVRKVTTTGSVSQSKQKSERIGLSESDESEGGDVKSKEKGKKLGDSEGRFVAVSQKMGSVLFQAKTSPAVSKEEGGDGIRRQGRSGRGLVAMRGNLTTASNEVIASENQKQLRSTRPGLEKTEKSSDMMPGRPPSKKRAAERKALAKPRRPVGSGTADLSGESDDDYEDLVAAAHAAVNASSAACSSNFWKQVEPYFTYLTRDDYEYLEQQVRGLEDTDLSLSALTRIERSELIDSGLCNTIENPIATIARNIGFLANGNVEADSSAVSKIFNNLNDRESGADVKKGIHGDWLKRMIPLSQRLLAALIVEDDIDEASEEDPSSDDPLDTERDGYLLIYNEQAKVERKHADWEAEEKRCNWACKPSLDDFSTTNGHRYYDEVGAENSVLAQSSEKTLYNSMTDARLLEFDERSTCLGTKMKENQSLTYQSGNWDVQYQQMNFDDRILLELQSIGLSPEPPDVAQRNNDDIGEELKRMQLKLKDQVVVNKERVQVLDAVIATSREPEERERERLAMMKLVEVAYARRTGCKAGISFGNKGSSSKGARAAALAFAKRVLARWQNYVETEKSCFTESGLRNILFHFSSKESTPRGAVNDSEAGDICTTSAAVEPESLRVYDSKLPVENVGRLLRKEKTETDLSDSGQNTVSEQTGGKDDVCSSRIRREVLLEDMVGSGAVVESAMLGGTKGKRSERDRDGKSDIRDSLERNEGSKGVERPGTGSIKGERKAKTKPRQKTAPLLKTVNASGKVVDKLTKGKCESFSTDRLDAQVSPSEGDGPVDLSHLQLPGMDDLVAPDGLSGQGQDLGSWLDFEDPGLQDAPGDFVGLDVPMDDLSDLAMMM